MKRAKVDADQSDPKVQLTEQQLGSATLKIDQLNTRIQAIKDQHALEVRQLHEQRLFELRKEQEQRALEVGHLNERLDQLKSHLPWLLEGISTNCQDYSFVQNISINC